MYALFFLEMIIAVCLGLTLLWMYFSATPVKTIARDIFTLLGWLLFSALWIGLTAPRGSVGLVFGHLTAFGLGVTLLWRRVWSV